MVPYIIYIYIYVYIIFIANHLIYADDMVLMGFSPCALQELLYVCECYGKFNVIKYNPNKTVCMMVLLKWLKSITIPTFV